MAQQHSGQAMAKLLEAVTLQDELSHLRLALEWGQTVCARLLRVWVQVETSERLAYEDKVAAQVHVLEEATASLCDLHDHLAHALRWLKRHQVELRQANSRARGLCQSTGSPRSQSTWHANTPYQEMQASVAWSR